MKVLSLQVGVPQKVEWRGRQIETSMFKGAAPGPLKVSLTNIEGDRFAGTAFHGTIDSVFYVLGKETYKQMEQRLNVKLVNGQLGENATLSELDETKIEVGDIFEIGSTQVQATGPRVPCEKVNFITENPDGQLTFAAIQKPGVYFKIIKPGEVPIGSELKPIKKSNSGVSIATLYKVITDLRFFKKNDHPDRVTAILESPYINEMYKHSIQKQIHLLKLSRQPNA